MNPNISSAGSTIRINLQLLFAFALGWVSWSVWPSDPKWWSMGLLSIVLGCAAAGQIIEAIKLMVRVYRHDKALYEYVARGGAPKSSEMVSGDDLERAGMR